MATAAALRRRDISVATWVIPGLIAGMVFAMWAMVVGIFTSALWAPPQGIAQSVGIGNLGHDFQAVPFMVGIMAHMMNAVILGAVFMAIISKLRIASTSALIGSGMVYGLAIYAAMYWVLLRGVLTSTSNSFLTANPEWSWIAAHVMFGVALGAISAVYLNREVR